MIRDRSYASGHRMVGNLCHLNIRVTYLGLSYPLLACREINDQRRLDPNLSNLSPVIKSEGRVDIAEVIRRTVIGELGSTEVRANQVW